MKKNDKEKNNVVLSLKNVSYRYKDAMPDEYVLKYGKEAFLSLYDNAIKYGEFKLSYMKTGYNLSNIEDKWYKCFNNTVHTYLIGEPVIPLDSLFDLTIKLYNKNK